MRSSSLSRWAWLPSSLAALGLAAAAGCGQTDASLLDGDSPTAGGEAANDPESEGAFASDAAAAPERYRGNPLCRISDESAARCLPDDGWDACGNPPPDGGVPDGGVVLACRLDEQGAPACAQAASQGGGDGATCESGAECAPGFDCVAESNERQVCRRYCCSDSCADHRGMSGSSTFCDVQKLASGDRRVPVCMPIKSCELLTDGACSPKETCAVVNDEGATGCVANGNAGEGESCDEEHCVAGHTCLGQPGNRRCYKLCRTDAVSAACKAGASCRTATVFKDPAFGICLPDNP